MEGNHCYPPGADCNPAGLELPVIEYPNPEEGCSVTGGYVFLGRGVPSLVGAYVYGDFCSGRIWGLRQDGESLAEQRLLADTNLSITSFGADTANNLYILTPQEGIYRLLPAD